MKLGRSASMVLFLTQLTSTMARAKAATNESFEVGFSKYMASNCWEAMDPLYKASLQEFENKDRATLYLAHCQSIYLRNLDAAANLDRIKSKNLKKDDQTLYKTLVAKHRADIDSLHKLYFNATPYAGSGSNSPKSMKGDSSFYGLSLGVSRPTWSVSGFYESYTQKLVPATSTTFTQSMVGTQLGYFVLPSWRVSGSYTSIHGSTDQLNSVSVMGAQTDYYFSPSWSLFLEYYSSNYPKLLANSSSTYKYPASASEYVAGVGFPIYNGDGFGFNGSASYSGILLTTSTDKQAIANKNLADDTSRFEVVVSAYMASGNASLTYWSGKEVLGVRSRGAVVMDSTDLHKGGSKLGLGYTFNKNLGIGASYSKESYYAMDSNSAYRDFESSTMTGMLLVNW